MKYQKPSKSSGRAGTADPMNAPTTGYYRSHPCTEAFTCRHCGRLVTPENAGTQHRNHCPYCLYSLHLDNTPGDRASECAGLMEPIAVWVRTGGEWALVHRCKTCGVLHANRIAADDHAISLAGLALKPLCEPPFPWESLVGMEGVATE